MRFVGDKKPKIINTSWNWENEFSNRCCSSEKLRNSRQSKFWNFKKNWKRFFIIKIKVRLILSNWNVQTAKGVVKRIENCWRLKKDYPRPTRCCLFSRYMNPFLCKNDMLYKVKNIRLLRLWNGVKDFLISKIDKKLAVLKVHGFVDRGRFKHCWLYMLAPPIVPR